MWSRGSTGVSLDTSGIWKLVMVSPMGGSGGVILWKVFGDRDSLVVNGRDFCRTLSFLFLRIVSL